MANIFMTFSHIYKRDTKLKNCAKKFLHVYDDEGRTNKWGMTVCLWQNV